MDTIWNTAFGIDIDLQNKRNNLYFDKCEQFFRNAADLPLITYLISRQTIPFYNFIILKLMNN